MRVGTCIISAVFRDLAPAYVVREMFATKREELRQLAATRVTAKLAADGIIVKDVVLRDVRVPADYVQGMEGLLVKEQESERLTIELNVKQKMVRQAKLEAEADKAREVTAAESSDVPNDTLEYRDDAELSRDTSGPDNIVITMKRTNYLHLDSRPRFRVHFAPRRAVDYIPESTTVVSTQIHLYPTLEENLPPQDYERIKRLTEPTVWSWLGISTGVSAIYSDDGFTYRGKKGEVVGGRFSPMRSYLLVESLDVHNAFWNDTYLDIFRRRDHANLARIHISCCGYATNYALVAHDLGWASDTDLIYLTGTDNSKCLVCRFDP